MSWYHGPKTVNLLIRHLSCSSTKCFFTTPSEKKYMRSSGPGSFHQVWGGKWKIHPKVFWKKPSHYPSSLRKLLLFPSIYINIFFSLQGILGLYSLYNHHHLRRKFPPKRAVQRKQKSMATRSAWFYSKPRSSRDVQEVFVQPPHIIYRLNVWFKNSPNISVSFKNHLTSKTWEKFRKISAFFWGGWEGECKNSGWFSAVAHVSAARVSTSAVEIPL